MIDSIFRIIVLWRNKMKKIEIESCECCTINKTQIKDYREDERTGNLDKYFVCFNCMNLNNYWFFRLLGTPTLTGKKRIIKKIIEDGWRKYLR